MRDFEILTHLNIFEEKKNQRAPPTTAPEYTEPEIVPYDDGRSLTLTWSEYDETVLDFLKTLPFNGYVYPKLAEIAVSKQFIP